MPKKVELSEFGEWCDKEGLSRKDVEYITGFSNVYVSYLFGTKSGKVLSEFWRKFFYEWWGEVLSQEVKDKILKGKKKIRAKQGRAELVRAKKSKGEGND